MWLLGGVVTRRKGVITRREGVVTRRCGHYMGVCRGGSMGSNDPPLPKMRSPLFK